MRRIAAAWILALASTALGMGAIHAGDGELDTSFGDNGRQIVAFDVGGQHVDRAHGLAVAPDGAIHLAGYVHVGANSAAIGLARLKVDGKPDDQYGQPVHLIKVFDWVQVTDAALQLDGKLVVAGYAQRASNRDIIVCRFMIDGDIDPVFGSALTPGCQVIDISPDDYAYGVAVKGDGGIVVAGKVLSAINRAVVASLDVHGIPDPSFGPGGVHILLPQLDVGTSLRDLALTPGGDLIAVGHVDIAPGDSDWIVFRLKAKDGSLHPLFDNSGIKQIHFDLGPSGVRRDYGRAVAVSPNGSIFITGHVQNAPGIYCMAAIRLTANGAFSTFGQNGAYVDPLCKSGLEVNDIAIQPIGQPVIAGSIGGDFLIYRLTSAGARDESFGVGGLTQPTFDLAGKKSIDVATRLAVGADIVVAGYAERAFDGYDYAVARLRNRSARVER